MNTKTFKWTLLGGAALAGAAVAGALAAPAAPTAPQATAPTALTETRGTVAHYELTPRGDLDGLILQDGTEVHFGPRLGNRIGDAVKLGDAVTISGEQTAGGIRATSVSANGQTIADQRPAPDQQMEATGKVAMALHGPKGDVNGVMLEDGTIVRLPPPEAATRADMLKPGQTIAVRGEGASNTLGKAIGAREIGPSMDKLTAVKAPPPPATGHTRGPATHRPRGPVTRRPRRRGSESDGALAPAPERVRGRPLNGSRKASMSGSHMRSLKARLLGAWALSLLSSLVLAALLVSLYRQSSAAQIGRAQAVLARSCDLLRDRYGFATSGWSGEGKDVIAVLRQALVPVAEVALARQRDVEGGFWEAGAGSLAYAFPSYEGTGPKTDVPQAELGAIGAINEEAARAERTVARTIVARNQTLLLAACPMGGPIAGLTGWTMTRVHSNRFPLTMTAGLLTLFALLLLTALVLGWTMRIWSHHVRGIELALGDAPGASLPPLGRTGERELDRIIDALNGAGGRLASARAEQEALARRVAQAERLAALGRVAAGVAHEIRNPIAAARLQGENGLAGDDGRRQKAIGDMIGQLDRLDGLVSELLAMTQRADPAAARVDLPHVLHAAAARHAPAAAACAVGLTVDAPPATAMLDPGMVGRILDNLLTNAIRHAEAGGEVALSARRDDGLLTLSVANTGPGIPADMVGRLFEPFVTGRADGTGLGLAIARELADAHGGRLLLRNPGGGGALTDFALELPQPPSGTTPCPPS